MTKDNSTGKDKEFYELGKKMFDRLNPQIAHNPKVVGYVAPQREWVGLTNKDIIEMWPETSTVGWDDIRLIEAKLKEKNT